MQGRGTDAVDPGAPVHRARRGEGFAGEQLRVEPVRRALGRVLVRRQCARERFGREVIAEAGQVSRCSRPQCIGSGACEVIAIGAGAVAVGAGAYIIYNKYKNVSNEYNDVAQTLVSKGTYDNVCAALDALLAGAQTSQERLKIVQAQKAAGCRNRQKRG